MLYFRFAILHICNTCSCLSAFCRQTRRTAGIFLLEFCTSFALDAKCWWTEFCASRFPWRKQLKRRWVRRRRRRTRPGRRRLWPALRPPHCRSHTRPTWASAVWSSGPPTPCSACPWFCCRQTLDCKHKRGDCMCILATFCRTSTFSPQLVSPEFLQ